MNEFWSACLNRFEQELPAQQFNTWIKGLRLERDEAGPTHFRLIAPNRFVMQWVRERYLAQIEAFGLEFFSAPVNISLRVADTVADIPVPTENTESAPSPTAPVAPAVSARPTNAEYEKTRLNADFTFDTLVTGRANDLARAAAQQVAMNPGVSYNPLFIYGGVGLGKTHLIHAIGNSIYAANPTMEVRYVHAEDYFSDVVRAFQQNSREAFKRYYRSLDLLLIDDIQFFNRKDRTQEEFFYAFNALIEAKKQIIITCDTYPKDVQGLEERLVSRFDWGLTVAIEPPELEMRIAILKKKAEAEQISVSDEVSFLIAKNLKSNVRELEGALNRVVAYARFHGRDISLDVAKEALRDIIGATNRQISLELVQKTVSDFYKIKVADMYSQKRTRAIARPRQIAMWLTRELTSHSLPEIGEAFGGRDHTTVMHACRTIIDLRGKDTRLNNDLHVLMQTIKG
ncbi:chromosomal replication initiator protein DnaA [Sulfuritalea hydrogenivorans]|uniref:Chromosomal replication initiator protein DnaA n=1 Tax=Sulfuritalea hydrogenivorans sk43H TaxID=1223802 RepID=W0SA31_9PROT|nr:chromosomal replication initiator protein DnaA [Sulfuritalea hydrogenivorans]BAO27821.1 chromosomal replication initiation protein [Sulfuritalea hydrogenivorans sk43H]